MHSSLGGLLSGSGGHAYSGSRSVACMGEQAEWFSGTGMHCGSEGHMKGRWFKGHTCSVRGSEGAAYDRQSCVECFSC